MKGIRTFTVLAIVLVSAGFSSGQVIPQSKFKRTPAKILGYPFVTVLDVNNLTTWVQDDGLFPPNVKGSWNGEFPRGSGVGVMFSEGSVFGGLVDDGQSPIVRFTGSTYATGMQGGTILTDAGGNVTGAENHNDPDVRVWRVRPDVRPNEAQVRDLTSDAAACFQEPATSVTLNQEAQLEVQYHKDWMEWPADKGAPWYMDTVGVVRYDNGYDPSNSHDIPGIPRTSQTIWYVCNDLWTQSTALLGSPSIGIEEQVTLWAYSTSTLLNDVYFKDVKLIYKGTTQSDANSQIDSMYYCEWRDTDMGYNGDDFSGCDSTLNLGYSYNAEPVDPDYAAVGLVPPAIGCEILGSVSHYTGNANDSTLMDFQWRYGYAQQFRLPMTAYAAHQTASGFTDPDWGESEGAPEFFNIMRGDNVYPPYPEGNPLLEISAYAKSHDLHTSYMLSGDPLTKTGWIDGIDVDPGDRRDYLISGPFTFRLHDTAEVIIAMIGGLGTDYLSSLARVEKTARLAQDMYNSGFRAVPPKGDVATEFADSSAIIHVRADARGEGVTAINALLRRADGSLVTEFPLYDDGKHDDCSASDGIFADTVNVPAQPGGLHIDLEETTAMGKTAWGGFAENVTTNGPISLSNPQIVQDNLNQDGKANPGEVIRTTFTVQNAGSLQADSLLLYAPHEYRNQTLTIPSVAPHSTYMLNYSASVPTSYMQFQVPSAYGDSAYKIPITIRDQSADVWQDTVYVQVYPLKAPFGYTPVRHPEGKATGSFTIRIVEPDSVKSDTYEIIGVDSIDAIRTNGITLIDSTTGKILFANHSLPDKLGDNMPVTDGFIVAGTSADSGYGMIGYNVLAGTVPFSWVNGAYAFIHGFNGAIGFAPTDLYLMAGTLPQLSHSVLLKFATTDSNGKILNPNDTDITMAYRYVQLADDPLADSNFLPIVNPGSGYAYQDRRPVPVAAFDEDENDKRLDIGFLESNTYEGSEDGKYWPPYYADRISNVAYGYSGRDEWLFIFSTTYNESTDNPAMTTDIKDNRAPIIWWITATRAEKTFSSNDAFEIVGFHPVTSNDIWTFNPLNLTSGGVLPTSYVLQQNYPNPFNPRTAIQFSIPKSGFVSVKVYNILGQEIATVTDQELQRGTYTMYWNGTNRYGDRVASGVYFYRIVAGNFVQTKKMMLLK